MTGSPTVTTTWVDLRRLRTRPPVPDPDTYSPADLPPGAVLGGCLRQVLFLGLIFVIVVIGLAFLAGGPLLQILLQILLSQ